MVLVDPSERTWSQTDCLLDGGEAELTVRIRFLQAQRRTVLDAAGVEVESLQTDDASYVPWDEAVERHVDISVSLDELPCERAFEIPGGVEDEAVGPGSFDGPGSLSPGCLP